VENGESRSLVVRCGGLCRVRSRDSGGVHRTPETEVDSVVMRAGTRRPTNAARRARPGASAGSDLRSKDLSYIEASVRRNRSQLREQKSRQGCQRYERRGRQHFMKAALKTKHLPARGADFLIANAGLEFRATRSKRTHIIISNREYIAVFQIDFSRGLPRRASSVYEYVEVVADLVEDFFGFAYDGGDAVRQGGHGANFVGVHSVQDDGDAGTDALELAGGVEAVHARHAQVEDDERGVGVGGFCERVDAIDCLGADFQTGAFKKLPKLLPDCGEIIDDENGIGHITPYKRGDSPGSLVKHPSSYASVH